MDAKSLSALARALKAEKPEGSQVIQGERIVWRRIVERISELVPEASRAEFLSECDVPAHLSGGFLAREATRGSGKRPPKVPPQPPRDMTGDPAFAIAVVSELRNLHGMTNEHFRALHHRRNLRPSDGISAHLRYLSSVETRLRTDQQQLARRLEECLRHRRAGSPWSKAVELALQDVPLTPRGRKFH